MSKKAGIIVDPDCLEHKLFTCNPTAGTETQHVLHVVQKQQPPSTLTGTPSYETIHLLNPLMPKYIYHCIKKKRYFFKASAKFNGDK